MLVTPEVIAFVSGFPVLMAHLGVVIGLYVFAATLYTLTSRGREVQQVRDGNPGSAVIYGATLLALALPLARTLSGSAGLLDIAIWGGAALLVQLTLFALADLVLAGLSQRIRDEGDLPGAVLLGAARLATAVLFAAALSV